MRRSSRSRTVWAAITVLLLSAGLGACGAPQHKEGRAITVWSLENVSERITATQKNVDRFTERTGIEVELVAVDENQLSQLIMSSAAAGTLPDVIGSVPLSSLRQMASNELLHTTAAGKVVTDLGPDTFNSRALELTSDGTHQLGVPSDAWAQLLYYRKDLFAKAGLPAPTTYQDITRAARALDGKRMQGISLATDPNDAFTQQSFEYLALANSCELVDSAGEVRLDSPACEQAFSFYGALATRYSAQGTQTVDSTRATYFAGDSAMIVWSSFLLDELAGLRNDALPSCPQCRKDPGWLADNTGVVSAVKGPDSEVPAQFGEMTSWTVTHTAQVDSSRKFIEYMLNDGYPDWFGMAPEGKFPARSGTPQEPDKFQRIWNNSKAGVDTKKPLSGVYPSSTIAQLREGQDRMQRWGITQGQGSLVGATVGELPVPKAISALASGQVDGPGAQKQAHEEVSAIQKSLR
ncbi:ABC transporter substrate-binding protein [Streptomyces sp. SYSU K217416]